ncbi:MAG: RNA polymerase sigma factor [Paramuribaculum sp.]|nr:RNA polymerase sigma factor [Paramuribaculum sp.]
MNTSSFQSELMKMQNVMLNFAYTLTHNSDDAQDLLQDTMLKVISSEDKYTANTNFKGWVLTIMRNIFINNHRKMSRMATVHDTSDNDYVLNVVCTDMTAESPEDCYSTSEIQQAIDELDEIYRVPFVMLVSGYKYNEIAEEMDIPVGTIKSRIFYVRQQLQVRFADHR